MILEVGYKNGWGNARILDEKRVAKGKNKE